MSKMNAILINKFGGPENCEYTPGLAIPEPNENQVIFSYKICLIF